MKALNIFLLLAFFSISQIAGATEPTRNNQTTQQEERAVGTFKGIASGGSVMVMVTMGNKETIRFEGDEEAIAQLITEVKNDVLIIRPKTKWNDWSRRYRDAKVTVYINAKKLNSLTMSGSGGITVSNTINTSELVATLSGSGGIKAATSCKSLVGVISGSGTLYINGKADNTNLTLSGSGSFFGKNFTAQRLSAQISGSANVFINVEDHIEAVISGSGSISYSGNPKIEKTIIGSGRIKKF